MGRAEAPRRVDGYVIHGAIASGGTATVHYGWREGAKGFGRLVAIKALHPHLAQDPEIVAMLGDEARLASRLHHPNIAPVLDVVQSGGELLLVMEYVAGVSLSLLLRTAAERGIAIDPRIVVAIAVSVLRALHAAHETIGENGKPLGLVHRDVSPQNVLIGTEGVVRLVDFGVAKAAGRVQMTRDGQRKGKLAYMAPEQIDGGAIDRRCDVYAASIVLWELLTGEELFAGGDEAAVLRRHLEDVRPPSAVRSEARPFDDVVLRGLAREPRRRYPTARAMADALAECAEPATTTEVSEWVRGLAGEALAEREAEAAQVEAAYGTERGAGRAPVAEGGGRGASVAQPKDGPGEEVTRIEGVRARAVKGMGEAAPPRRRPVVLAGIAALVIAVGAIALARGTGRDASPVNGATSVSAASMGTAPAAPASSSEGRTDPSDEHDGHEAHEHDEAFGGVSGALGRGAPDASAHPHHPPDRKPSPGATAKHPKQSSACTPPFRVDADGVRRYKLECL